MFIVLNSHCIHSLLLHDWILDDVNCLSPRIQILSFDWKYNFIFHKQLRMAELFIALQKVITLEMVNIP